MARRKASKRTRNAKSKWSLQTFDSMADADKADREYWWSRSPAERMRELSGASLCAFTFLPTPAPWTSKTAMPAVKSWNGTAYKFP
jgi:hypothetical protein